MSMTVGGLVGKIAVPPLSETLQKGALVVGLVLICGLLISNLILLSVRRPESTVGSGKLALYAATILAVIFAVGVVVAALLYAAYQFPGTSGFGRSDFTRETTHYEETTGEGDSAFTRDVVEEPRRAKTLWDWLQLLIVPVLLAGGGIWFNLQQERRNHEGEDQRECDAAVQSYIDQIGRLLVDRYLRTSTRSDDVYQLARTLTLRVLKRLNESLVFYPGANSVPLQKREVLDFLYLSKLIEGAEPVISLEGADMTSINLADTTFIGINLMGAKIVDAVLDRANLTRALLLGAALDRANLDRTILRSANLTGATVSKSQLRQCGSANLEGATMYDGTLFTPGFLSD